ncbi:MAG: hypothetical protein AAGJ31_11575, partial [Verrucomicrobiota bacterium]
EIALHLANLRAGHRFDADRGERYPSERLGMTCRQAYGTVDYTGYLHLGLPEGYGEGAAEALADHLSKGKKSRTEGLGAGDVERAFVEWLSLLRHLIHAPDLPSFPRWEELRSDARKLVGRYPRQSEALQHLPKISPHLLHTPVEHRFTLKPPR